MNVFYNVIGTIIAVMAGLMLCIPSLHGSDRKNFNTAKYYLAAMFLLTALSSFTAQFDDQIVLGTFQKLNMLMLLFFFIIARGFIIAIITLYASANIYNKYFRITFYPILSLFGLYAVLYFTIGDVPVYSIAEYFALLPHEIMLILRLIILIAVLASTIHSTILCHKAAAEYRRFILNYFSETDFARSIWLSRLLWSGEAIIIWIFLSYFYTTPVLEVIIGVLTTLLFAFYILEFYEYSKRFSLINLTTGVELITTDAYKEGGEKQIDTALNKRITDWTNRTDKPYTQAKLTINDVARDMCIPRYKLSGYVNNNSDNFCSWINNLRIAEAERLLVENMEMPISEIAECTGFCDLPAFSRAFKKIKGVSPRTFRNSL